jgi:hypothetical protein
MARYHQIGALADPDIDPALAQIVEQRQPDGASRTGWWNGSCTTAKPLRILSVRHF